MKTSNPRLRAAMSWLLLLATGPTLANISGMVFQDYNDNAQIDISLAPGTQAIDAGIGGVTITIFDSLGVSVGSATSCGVTVAGVCTGSNPGFYDIAVAGTAPYRVEFSALPASFQPAAQGAGSGSTVQFVASGTTANVDVGINIPPEYCQNNPEMIITTYTGGNPISGANAGRACLLSFRYGAGNASRPLVGGAGGHDDSGYFPLSSPVTVPANQIGATFGLGYHRASRTVVVSSFLRAFAGFGPAGGVDGSTGAIYQVSNPTSGFVTTASLLVDLNALPQFAADQPVAGINPHPNSTFNFNDNSDEGISGPLVGKRSLGDLDVSEDDSTVYVINANDRFLYRIPFANPVAGTTRVAFPTQMTTSGGAPLCNATANVRPFALAERDGLIYVGAVCSAEGGTAADLRTIVYTFNPGTSSFSTDPVFVFAMNYSRGCANGDPLFPASGTCGGTAVAAWQPWQDNSATTPSSAQPLIGDIVFDGDDMVIAYRDRYADQSAGFIRSAGEILRACFNGSAWNLESNGACGGLASNGVNQGQGPGDGGAVPAGDGEYYFGDAYSQFHAELGNGSLAQIPGFPEVAMSLYDPVFSGAGTTFDGGVRWMRNRLNDAGPGTVTRGDFSRAYRVFNDTGDFGPGDPFFGKANGLGDIEAMCTPAPLQVGNRVWCDRNHNGVQDASAIEAGVNGVQVQLLCGGFNTVSTTTNASGNYLFGDAAFIAANPASGGLPRGASCTLRIDPAAAGNAALLTAACGSARPTQPNVGGAGGDIRDSDAVANGLLLDVPVVLGQSGQNNHDQDFGLGGSDLGDLPDSAAGVGANNYETLLANGGATHPIVAGLRIGANLDAEADGQPNAAADGDDLAGAPDDEDGIAQASLLFLPSVVQNVQATVTNTTGSAARLCGFVDFNRDGDFADAGESSSIAVPNGSNNLAVVLPFTAAAGTSTGNAYARFRLSTDTAGACAANGAASDGEVEDYLGQVPPQDLGDLPDSAAGVGANNYETLIANGGPAHPILATLRIGANLDAEADGQPNVGADGDDSNGAPDDEDGVVVATLNFVPGLAQAVAATVTNTSGSAARLCGFIDFNRDGDFADGGENASAAVADGSGNVATSLNFTAPVAGSSGPIYARFRLSTDIAGACQPNGPASNGEVEDYLGQVATTDLGDLPDTAAGNGAGNYNTLRADNGAMHGIVANLFMGVSVDDELDGQPNAAADGDDSTGATDDEDGITVADLNLSAGASANVRFNATNNTGSPATACGFIDFNGNGVFTDAGESTQIAVPNGSNNALFTLAFGTVPVAAASNSYARFRLSTGAGCTAAGTQADGEVEDYPVGVTQSDLGDLPDSGAGIGAGNYETLLSSNGAVHTIVSGLFMGASVDPEGDGQPNAGANGDDINGLPDDEDGITLAAAPYDLGSPARATVVATNQLASAALACGFIDWNGDGDFSDANETAQIGVPSGSNGVSVVLDFGNTPLAAIASTYGRFRLSTDGVCSANGLASNGEVEDYVVTTTGNGALSLGNLVWEDFDNDGVVDAGEPGIANVALSLFLDSDQDCVPDGAALANTTTAVGGVYGFSNLLPGQYIVDLTPPTGYLGSTGTGRYAPSGPSEPAPDPDNDINNDDNGTAAGSVIRACTVELLAKQEPINDGDIDNNSNLSVDFGLLIDFDLALRKTLSPAQSAIVAPSALVSFTITVYNQGAIAAANIEITDMIPVGMLLEDANWTASGNLASRTIAGPLAPGASTSVTIALRIVNNNFLAFINLAEISAATDAGGTPRPDKDSLPDNDPGNDGPPVDDETGNLGGDEDDQDPQGVTLATNVPALNVLGLLALALAMLCVGAQRRSVAC